MVGAACTLMLKPGQSLLRTKGYTLAPDAPVRVPADIAGRILAGHADEVRLVDGTPIEPPSNATKAAALRALVGPDNGAALVEIKPIPAAARRVLLDDKATPEAVAEAAKAAGPWAAALLCRLVGLAKRAEACAALAE